MVCVCVCVCVCVFKSELKSIKNKEFERVFKEFKLAACGISWGE